MVQVVDFMDGKSETFMGDGRLFKSDGRSKSKKKVSLKSGKGNFPNGNISAKIDFLLSTVELPTKQFQNYVFESVPGVCNL